MCFSRKLSSAFLQFRLARCFVDSLYFNPKYDDFKPRTVYSLQNAFTSAFQKLEPIPEEPRYFLTVHGVGYKFVG